MRHFPTAEANGIVLIFISADPRFAGEPPAPPNFGLGEFTAPKFVVERMFAASMDNAVVGLMDPAHVPYVHNQWVVAPAEHRQKAEAKSLRTARARLGDCTSCAGV